MDAGGFTGWILAMQRGMVTGEGSDVPCDGCVACCTSGQLVPVEEDERSWVPADQLQAIDDGTTVLVHDDDGSCALLVEDRCTIYEHRPRACRVYDCRIFPAAGLEPEADKPAIADRANRWVFRFDTDEDRKRAEATRMTAIYLRTRQTGGRASSTTQLAAAAVLHHDELLT